MNVTCIQISFSIPSFNAIDSYWNPYFHTSASFCFCGLSPTKLEQDSILVLFDQLSLLIVTQCIHFLMLGSSYSIVESIQFNPTIFLGLFFFPNDFIVALISLNISFKQCISFVHSIRIPFKQSEQFSVVIEWMLCFIEGPYSLCISIVVFLPELLLKQEFLITLLLWWANISNRNSVLKPSLKFFLPLFVFEIFQNCNSSQNIQFFTFKFLVILFLQNKLNMRHGR